MLFGHGRLRHGLDTREEDVFPQYYYFTWCRVTAEMLTPTYRYKNYLEHQAKDVDFTLMNLEAGNPIL